MNISKNDDKFRQAHEVFQHDHEARRKQLLEKLPEYIPVSMTKKYQPFLLGLVGRTIAAASLLVIGTIVVYTLWQSPQRAYALDDLPNKLLEVKSIYLSGWIFDECGKHNKYPLTMFVERPNTYWFTHYGFSSSDSDADSQVTNRIIAGTGDKKIIMSPDEKSAFVLKTNPVFNELMAEMIIQTENMTGGSNWLEHLGDFKKVGPDTIDNNRCDLYEYMENKWMVMRLWINPKTGLPIKMATYQVDDSGKETMSLMIDNVEVNISADDKKLSFTPPADYKIEEGVDLDISLGSAGCDTSTLSGSYCINIDDKAVLVGWSYSLNSDKDTNDGSTEVKFILGKNRKCERSDVATTDMADSKFTWSIVYPEKHGESIGNDYLRIVVDHLKGGKSEITDKPLRFPEERLRTVIEELGKSAEITMLRPNDEFTLDVLRKYIAEKK